MVSWDCTPEQWRILGGKLQEIRLTGQWRRSRKSVANGLGLKSPHGYKFVWRIESGRCHNLRLSTVARLLALNGARWGHVVSWLPAAWATVPEDRKPTATLDIRERRTRGWSSIYRETILTRQRALGRRLRRLRKRAGLAQPDVGRLMGPTPKAGVNRVRLLEAGAVNDPTVRTVGRYLSAIGATWVDLVDFLPSLRSRERQRPQRNPFCDYLPSCWPEQVGLRFRAYETLWGGNVADRSRPFASRAKKRVCRLFGISPAHLRYIVLRQVEWGCFIDAVQYHADSGDCAEWGVAALRRRAARFRHKLAPEFFDRLLDPCERELRGLVRSWRRRPDPKRAEYLLSVFDESASGCRPYLREAVGWDYGCYYRAYIRMLAQFPRRNVPLVRRERLDRRDVELVLELAGRHPELGSRELSNLLLREGGNYVSHTAICRVLRRRQDYERRFSPEGQAEQAFIDRVEAATARVAMREFRMLWGGHARAMR
ncbi:helix-turn-helix domain-containing protein [candidate division WOR-3 bacterium]|nr:helix-turn-helix domain-containing protein [candidate division WOR-3 bacterium]